MSLYKDKIEKIAKLTDEENDELSNIRSEYQNNSTRRGGQAIKNILAAEAGIVGAGTGYNIARDARRDGALDGIVRRYHNTSAANVSGIKENGIKASKAVDPSFNTVTKTMAGLSNDEMKDLTYLARKRQVARGVGARREQIDNLKKGINLDEASAIKESFKNQKTLKVNIPLNKYRELNKVINPELKGAKNVDDTIKLMRDGIIRSTGNDALDRRSAKALHEMLSKNTDTIKGDIASEFIKGGRGYKGNTLKNFAKHIKNNPKMFAKGVAKGTAGIGVLGTGAYLTGKGISNEISQRKKFKEDNADKVSRINELYKKNFQR